jgi:hypothetical protein
MVAVILILLCKFSNSGSWFFGKLSYESKIRLKKKEAIFTAEVSLIIFDFG